VVHERIRVLYDGDGNRVAKCTAGSQSNTCPTGSTGTLYWRPTGGDIIAESSLTGTNLEEYIFFGGKRVARRDVSTNAVHYYFSDHLGSHGIVENATGSACEQDIDYYPYGGVEYDYCPNVAQNYKFTGKERDSESGLDNFGARYDASSIGRFMTPDWSALPAAVPYANLGDPQSLNLYSYVGNNPMSRVDTDGHDCQTIGQHTWCWNRSAFKSLRDAEDAHEAKHREDNKNDVDQPGWKKEQRGYAAELPVLEKRLSELEAKEKNGGLTDAEKKEKAELQEEHDTATSMTQGPEADRTAQRYYRNNQNWLVRQFIPDPDKDNKPRPQPPRPPADPPHRPNCIGCEGPPKPKPEDSSR